MSDNKPSLLIKPNLLLDMLKFGQVDDVLAVMATLPEQFIEHIDYEEIDLPG